MVKRENTVARHAITLLAVACLMRLVPSKARSLSWASLDTNGSAAALAWKRFSSVPCCLVWTAP